MRKVALARAGGTMSADTATPPPVPPQVTPAPAPAAPTPPAAPKRRRRWFWRLMALAFKALRSMQPDYDLWRDFAYEYERDRLAIDLINGS